MYINIQSKTSWSALGLQIANLAPVLWKPFSRGRVSLASPDPQEPLVEFDFTGTSSTSRFSVGVPRTVEMLAYERVRDWAA